MAKFYNLADQKLFEKYKFLPQEQYRLGLNLPTDPVPDPVVDQGIVNTDSFANSGGGGDGFNAAGNMFGEGTAVNPVYGGNPITGGFDGGYGVDPVTGDLPGGGNIVDEFGTEGEVYSKGAFDSLKGDDKKNFLSKMRASFRQKTENLPDWAKKGLTAAGMITAPAVTILGKIFGGGSGGGGGSYGIAGLTDQQKSMYNNLAASGFLYETPSGYKTKTGKNFTGKGYLEGQIKNFNEMTEEGYTIDSNGNVVKPDGTLASGYLKNKFLEAKLSEKNNTVTNPNITNPNITANMINEFVNNNDTTDTPVDTPVNQNNSPGYPGNPNNLNNPPSAPSYTPSPGDNGEGGQQNNGGGQSESQQGADNAQQGDNQESAGAGGYRRGGRAGYFFGGRAGYAEGGAIYPRLGTLSSGVQSAEQQLQSINASLQKAETDLGSESPGSGSSLAGGPSFTSNFEDANNQGLGNGLLFGGDSGGSIQNTMAPQEPGQTQPGPLSSYNSDTNTISQITQPGGGGRPIGGATIGGNPFDPKIADDFGSNPLGGGGRPIGGGPSPYEGPMKTMDQFGANIMIKEPGGLEAAYKDYTQKYQDYNKNSQGGVRPIGGGSGITTLPDGTPYDPGRPIVGGGGRPLGGGNTPFDPRFAGNVGDPRMGAQQIDGNQLQMMMRGGFKNGGLASIL
jgi:hypothetical protein